MKLIVIVPAYNESKIIYQVLSQLPKKLAKIDIETVVVDDGSQDKTSQEAQKANVFVLRHITNRGLGAAIKTGLWWARTKNADIAVTFDADGQHDPHDINKVIQPIISGNADLVVGSRFRQKQNIPFDRLVLNWLANAATLVIFGVFSTDSQSGMRAFSKKAIETIDYQADRMEFSSEILVEAKRRHLKIKEVPIKAIYTTYSRGKGQSNFNAVPVAARILVKFLR